MYLIPAEIADQIIDYLYNDSITLKQCSLVCKGWIPSTRFHLFSSISIDPRQFNEGVEFSIIYGSTFIPYVRRLKIEDSILDKSADWYNNNLPWFPTFPAVDQLVLDCLNWNNLTTDAKFFFLDLAPKLRSFEAIGVEFGRWEEAQDLISAAPLLVRLSLKRILASSSTTGPVIYRDHPTIPKLQLDLWGNCANHVCRWLLNSPCIVLDMHGVSIFHMMDSARIFGSTLVHLKVDLMDQPR